MSSLSKIKYQSNEIGKTTDFNSGESFPFDNLVETVRFITDGKQASIDAIISGFQVSQRSPVSMSVDVSPGIGFNSSDDNIIHSDNTVGPVAIEDGGAQDRIDIIQARLVETDYDTEQRAFKDPQTEAITYQDVPTKTRYELEVAVVKGTEGAGVAPSKTSGWVKLAEVFVAAGNNVSILDANISNITATLSTESNSSWTTDTNTVYRLGTVDYIKNIVRTNFNEDGSYKVDSIKDTHIDWGNGAGQVGASDIPILDTAGNITATTVEGALAELAAFKTSIGVDGLLVGTTSNPGLGQKLHVAGSFSLTGDVIGSDTVFSIRSTVDTNFISLEGGSSANTANGAYIQIAGESQGAIPGQIRYFTGDSGFHRFYVGGAGSGDENFRIGDRFLFGNPIPTDDNSTTFQFSGSAKIINNISLKITDGVSSTADKLGRLMAGHYNNDSTNFTAIYTRSISSANILHLGGGTSSGNAATEVRIYVGSNTTNGAGTQIASYVPDLMSLTGNLEIIATASLGSLRIANTATSGSGKIATITSLHYDNSTEEVVTGMMIQPLETISSVYIGGGVANQNAATRVRIYAAANTTTLSGTAVAEFLTTGVELFTGLTVGGAISTTSGGITSAAGLNGTQLQLINTTQNDGVTILAIGSDVVAFRPYINGALVPTEDLRYNGSTSKWTTLGDFSVGGGLGVVGVLTASGNIVGGGTLTGVTSITANGNLTLGTGSANRAVQFAGDASILWNETPDRFDFSKSIHLGGDAAVGDETLDIESDRLLISASVSDDLNGVYLRQATDESGPRMYINVPRGFTGEGEGITAFIKPVLFKSTVSQGGVYTSLSGIFGIGTFSCLCKIGNSVGTSLVISGSNVTVAGQTFTSGSGSAIGNDMALFVLDV